MTKGEAPLPERLIAANDAPASIASARVDAALKRIAEAIGRHIAREQIRLGEAANDNEKMDTS